MPKFATYQRPAPVNKQTWGGKPGVAYGKKPAKKAPKPAPEAGKSPALDIKLPDLLAPKQ
jgi:hypothetical protein